MKKLIKICILLFTTLLIFSCGTNSNTDEPEVEINVFGFFPAGNDNFSILAIKAEEIPNEWETNDSLLFIEVNSNGELIEQHAIHVNERANIIRPYFLSNGNILFYGNIREYYSWDFSAWEYTPQGQQNWELYLGESINGIAPSSDDDLFVFSWGDKPYVEGKDNYDDVVIIKLETNGDTVWTKSIPSNVYNQSLRVGTPTNDNGCLTLGVKYVEDRSTDMWALRFDENGDTLWSQTYGGDRYDDFHSVQELNDGNFLIVGMISLYDSTNNDYNLNNGEQSYLIKLDANGNKLWTKAIGRTLREKLTGAIEGRDGSIILCGYVSESYSYYFDTDMGWIQKLDANGELIWRREFEDKLPMGVRELSTGEIIVATQNNDPEKSWGYDETINVIKVSSSGTLLTNVSLIP